MVRVREVISGADEDAAASELLRSSGRALVSSVGGASGPLYGTFLLEAAEGLAAEAVAPAREPIAALAPAFARGVAGIGRRGRSTIGQKTMLDTLVPAAEALRRGAAEPQASGAAARSMVAAAAEGCESTRPMIAQRGRASYLGERAIGHLDPGAVSALIVVEALAAALEDQPAETGERLRR